MNRAAGAELWQPEVQITWQAQHFAAMQGQVQILWQAQHVRKVKYIQISWQVQHFRKLR